VGKGARDSHLLQPLAQLIRPVNRQPGRIVEGRNHAFCAGHLGNIGQQPGDAGVLRQAQDQIGGGKHGREQVVQGFDPIGQHGRQGPLLHSPMLGRAAAEVISAQFIQTQLIYNVERFREFMKRVVDMGLHEKVSIMAGVGPIRSKVAEYMANQVAGMDVPDKIVARLRGLSKEDQAKAGIDICCEIANEARQIEGVRGLHIMAVSWHEAVPEVAKNLLVSTPHRLIVALTEAMPQAWPFHLSLR